jgi:hypothetical protein
LVKYAINTATETQGTHSVLIGTPLVLVLVFAFGFILMHPAKSTGETAAAATTHKPTGIKSGVAAPLPLTQTTLPTLSPVPTDGSDSAPTTTSPQAAGSSPTSTPASAGVQAAVPNTSSTSSKKPLSTKPSHPQSLLGGLLKVL